MYCACRLEKTCVLERNQTRNETQRRVFDSDECGEMHLLIKLYSSSVYCVCLQGPEGEVGPVGAQGGPGADVSRLS